MGATGRYETKEGPSNKNRREVIAPLNHTEKKMVTIVKKGPLVFRLVRASFPTSYVDTYA